VQDGTARIDDPLAGPPPSSHDGRIVSVTIDLLGPPKIGRSDGQAPMLRGRKAWALLAYLILGRPSSRERLAGLLFETADDPLGALRWNLAELRRALGPEVTLGGDPVVLTLPPGSIVDVLLIGSGPAVQALALRGLGQELLEGIDPAAGAPFEMWLLAERARLAGVAAAILREAATARLASGDTTQAVGYGTRLLALDDLDEEAHALLIRAYVRAGETQRARQQLQASVTLLREQLGVEPSATLTRALASRDPVG
jgi:DNA-binding SARP family transcriptional activator